MLTEKAIILVNTSRNEVSSSFANVNPSCNCSGPKRTPLHKYVSQVFSNLDIHLWRDFFRVLHKINMACSELTHNIWEIQPWFTCSKWNMCEICSLKYHILYVHRVKGSNSSNHRSPVSGSVITLVDPWTQKVGPFFLG